MISGGVLVSSEATVDLFSPNPRQLFVLPRCIENKNVNKSLKNKPGGIKALEITQTHQKPNSFKNSYKDKEVSIIFTNIKKVQANNGKATYKETPLP